MNTAKTPNLKIGLSFICFSMLAYWFMGTPLSLKAQSREPQNIYRVRVASRYIFEDGKRTSKFFAIEQQLRDSLDRLHTEIFFDWATHNPDKYRWRYFDGQVKYKTDFFENEKLVRIEEYAYTKDSLLNQLIVKKVTDGKVDYQGKVTYSYNTDGKIIQTDGFNEKGKRCFKAKYIYDANGTEIERKVKAKKCTPPDSILFLNRTVSYDSLGRIATEKLILEKVGKGRSIQNMGYTYDKNGNITEMILKDEHGATLQRNEYQYRNDNRIKLLNIYNADNEQIDCIAWRYELYKTNDRRQRMYE